MQSDEPPLIDGLAFSPWGEPYDVVEGGIPFDLWGTILQWRERINEWERQQQAETAKPKEDTIRAHVDDYLATRKAASRAKGKLGSYDTLRCRVCKLPLLA